MYPKTESKMVHCKIMEEVLEQRSLLSTRLSTY